MYPKEEYHEYDYTCEICGCGYYAEVGFSIGCGNHTQSEIDAFFQKRKEDFDIEFKKRRRRVNKSYEDLNDIYIQMEDDDLRPY